MQPIIHAADPLPFKSHPCPLFCLHTPAGEQHELEMQMKFCLTLNRLNAQGAGETIYTEEGKGKKNRWISGTHASQTLPRQMRYATWFPEEH